MLKNILLLLFISSFVLPLSSQLIDRIGIFSCNNPNYQSTWHIISSYNVTRLISLGDIMYADQIPGENWHDITRITPIVIQQEYEKVKQNKDYINLINSVKSIDYIFDDHDLGINDGDGNFKYLKETQEIFWNFIDSNNNNNNNNNGIYNSRNVKISDNFTYKIILMDTRSFKMSSNEELLGNTQWNWLEEQMNDENIDLILLGSSIQILPTEKFIEESWNEYPKAREKLLNLIGQTLLKRKVILLSGDIHSGEILQTIYYDKNQKYRLYELTSSGLTHSFTKHTAFLNNQKQLMESEEYSKTMPGIKIFHKTIFADIILFLYSFGMPQYYRENNNNDQFNGPNFGYIDIILLNDNNIQVIFNLVDLENNKIINTKYLELDSVVTDKYYYENSFFLPFYGNVPIWHKILYLSYYAFISLLFIIFPILLILWFVGASFYYIFFGYEIARRDRIKANKNK